MSSRLNAIVTFSLVNTYILNMLLFEDIWGLFYAAKVLETPAYSTQFWLTVNIWTFLQIFILLKVTEAPPVKKKFIYTAILIIIFSLALVLLKRSLIISSLEDQLLNIKNYSFKKIKFADSNQFLYKEKVNFKLPKNWSINLEANSLNIPDRIYFQNQGNREAGVYRGKIQSFEYSLMTSANYAMEERGLEFGNINFRDFFKFKNGKCLVQESQKQSHLALEAHCSSVHSSQDITLTVVATQVNNLNDFRSNFYFILESIDLKEIRKLPTSSGFSSVKDRGYKDLKWKL